MRVGHQLRQCHQGRCLRRSAARRLVENELIPEKRVMEIFLRGRWKTGSTFKRYHIISDRGCGGRRAGYWTPWTPRHGLKRWACPAQMKSPTRKRLAQIWRIGQISAFRRTPELSITLESIGGRGPKPPRIDSASSGLIEGALRTGDRGPPL